MKVNTPIEYVRKISEKYIKKISEKYIKKILLEIYFKKRPSLVYRNTSRIYRENISGRYFFGLYPTEDIRKIYIPRKVFPWPIYPTEGISFIYQKISRRIYLSCPSDTAFRTCYTQKNISRIPVPSGLETFLNIYISDARRTDIFEPVGAEEYISDTRP